MIPILVAALVGGSAAVIVAIIHAEWVYLLTAPLVGSALALVVASLLAMRSDPRAEDSVEHAFAPAADPIADDMVARLMQAGRALARYEPDDGSARAAPEPDPAETRWTDTPRSHG